MDSCYWLSVFFITANELALYHQNQWECNGVDSCYLLSVFFITENEIALYHQNQWECSGLIACSSTRNEVPVPRRRVIRDGHTLCCSLCTHAFPFFMFPDTRRYQACKVLNTEASRLKGAFMKNKALRICAQRKVSQREKNDDPYETSTQTNATM